MMDNIDFSKAAQCTLSLRLSAEGFACSVYDPLGDPPVTCCDYATDESLSLTANVKRMFREVQCLNHAYRNFNVLMAGRRVAFVPLELFEDEQAEAMFYYNHPRADNEEVHYNILHKSNVVVLFGMDRSVCAYLSGQCPAVRFYAQSTPLIEYFTVRSRLGNSRKVYVNLRGEGMDVYVFERGRLQLGNVFACRETTDCAYYLLYLWKQLHLDQERDELHLTGGTAEKREALLTLLKKYVRQVFVLLPVENLDLQNITLCE